MGQAPPPTLVGTAEHGSVGRPLHPVPVPEELARSRGCVRPSCSEVLGVAAGGCRVLGHAGCLSDLGPSPRAHRSCSTQPPGRQRHPLSPLTPCQAQMVWPPHSPEPFLSPTRLAPASQSCLQSPPPVAVETALNDTAWKGPLAASAGGRSDAQPRGPVAAAVDTAGKPLCPVGGPALGPAGTSRQHQPHPTGGREASAPSAPSPLCLAASPVPTPAPDCASPPDPGWESLPGFPGPVLPPSLLVCPGGGHPAHTSCPGWPPAAALLRPVSVTVCVGLLGGAVGAG